MPDVPVTVTEPAGHGYFLLCEKLHPFLALHVQIAEEGLVPSVEREPGHRGRHANVYANHAAFDPVLELARGLTGAGEDGSAVAVR